MKKFIIISIILISCGPANREKRIQRTFDLANQRLEQGYYDDAIALYSEVITKNAELTDAFMNRGVAYFESGRYALALADYNHVYFNYPDYTAVVFNRIYCHLALGRLKAAEEDLNQLKILYPDSALIDVIEGLFWEKQRRLNKSLECFEAAASREPNNFDAWSNSGIINFQLQNFEQAEEDLLQALKLNVNAPEALNPLALVYWKQGKLLQADSVIDLALRIIPNEPYFLNNKATIALEKGQLALADSLLILSMNLDSANAHTIKNLGWLALQKEDCSRANDYFSKSMSMDSFLMDNYDLMVKCYERLGRKADANHISALKTKYLPQ